VQAVIRRSAFAALVPTGLITPLYIIGLCLIGLGLTGLGLAGPARAGAFVGCTGNTCSVSLNSLITLKGDVGNGAVHVQLPVPQPPCLWQPIGDTTAGSSSIIRQFGSVGPGTPFGVFQAVQQAKTLLKHKPVPPGTWWQLPVNPAASKAAQKLCDTLPLFDFTPPGQVPPTPPVPLQTLADYAYNHMGIPAPTLTVNPAGHGYVNLATYVWGRTLPVSVATGRPDAYEVTATLGGETVSVWARLAAKGAFSVGANGPGTPYSACGPNGSRFRVGHPPASSGAGTPPDCGVLWQAPVAGASVSATVTWSVTWGAGVLNGPGPNAMPPIQMTGRTPPFPVAEIQSINGG
jgi:hypothetical protein